MGESLLNANRERHHKGVAPDGTPWQPLAPSTLGNEIWQKQAAAMRRGNSKRGAVHSIATANKVRANRRPLWKTGEMLGPRMTMSVAGNVLRIGFDVDRAARHHFGTGTHGPRGAPYVIRPKVAKALAFGGLMRKRVTHPGIPARPLLGLPPADERLAEQVASDHLLAVLNRISGV